MVRDIRKGIGEEGFEWGADLIEAEIRTRIRSLIEGIVAEELEAALGAGKSQRVGAACSGYRHGSRERQLTTSPGPTTIMMPRARLQDGSWAGKRVAQPGDPPLSAAHGADRRT